MGEPSCPRRTSLQNFAVGAHFRREDADVPAAAQVIGYLAFFLEPPIELAEQDTENFQARVQIQDLFNAFLELFQTLEPKKAGLSRNNDPGDGDKRVDSQS